MSLIVSLFMLLATAHALGRFSTGLNQPALAGHLLAGVLLGPSLLGWIEPGPSLRALSDAAVLIVVLHAGLEMRLQHVSEELRGWNAAVLSLGFVLPAAAGWMVATAFQLPGAAAAVVALCVAVTALPVALQILSSLGLLETRFARVAIASALLSDVLVFALLGAIIDASSAVAAQRGVALSAALALGKVLGLVGIAMLARALCSGVARRLSANETGPSPVALVATLLFVLAFGAASELVGFHFAIGAFLAALMISPELIGERAFEQLAGATTVFTVAFFGPLFLAFQGLQFHLESLARPAFACALLAVAVFAKFTSGYIVGRLRRMSASDAWGVGVVMNARGVMELVAASIALRAGLIDAEIFSALVLLGLVTTILTPLLLKRWQARGELDSRTVAQRDSDATGAQE